MVLAAYDWRRALDKVVSLWPYFDEIIVAWDGHGLTWGGQFFEPPDAQDFEDTVYNRVGMSAIKLRVVVGDFWFPGRTRLELEVAERNALSMLLKRDSWICTVDADEEWIDPAATAAWLRTTPNGGMAAAGRYLGVYKVIDETALVYNRAWKVEVATSVAGQWGMPRASAGLVPSPCKFVNWFLADRDEAEVRLKLGAMEYAERHDPEPLVAEWKRTTLDNYHSVRGFAGNYVGVPLVPISVADLRAGRWGDLAP